ncbi:Lrp/AsnC family transcriptional regulator [Salinibacterium sp. NSLL150]|uniref:Lrp/AsnC family transcriptional regulator n=1 Tax=unclassified Salinibacterium TaxID=2632331 RepID=UPI0018CFACED|nr:MULTISPECIES: Lrp/AsnC family transcriptional regulator [unclassified Salinibacterium]MBH0024622.1 Lrp/AsnC family transcriptional regulator [Salinibacterium sp. SWN248]MBH0054646.1 Lrp/AsnC family transcriptional regulator [Salinibacterium sp. SWN139]MBH0084202.1 Lrp/AsnC family transcriptional regulator [Salinibacterium sp. SWN167]MBH0099566.1 Lrp/AsnC family transcriptional regulator [Salinibacterium sp. NSLL35]MBH0102320.1 Lrp/AsnC family transcriptional regulator [Salinibacterium sp. N
MSDLDDLDRRLLAALRADARESVASLSRRLNVTRATVTSRIDRLVSNGTVLGFSIRIREDRDPSFIRAIAFVEVEGRSTDSVISQLRGLPEIHELHTTNGAWDLVADIRTDSLSNFDRVLARMRNVEGVVNSETSLLLSSALL